MRVDIADELYCLYPTRLLSPGGVLSRGKTPVFGIVIRGFDSLTPGQASAL